MRKLALIYASALDYKRMSPEQIMLSMVVCVCVKCLTCVVSDDFPDGEKAHSQNFSYVHLSFFLTHLRIKKNPKPTDEHNCRYISN